MEKDADQTRTDNETDQFFQDRQTRADFEAFDRIMERRGGEPPIPGDELPE
jgi:hypothetical protein